MLSLHICFFFSVAENSFVNTQLAFPRLIGLLQFFLLTDYRLSTELILHNVELNIAFVPRRGYIGNMDESEGT